jgi:hypothetical protein
MHLEQNVALFDQASDDILLLDFSFINLKFYKVGSPEFIELVDSFYKYIDIAFTGADGLQHISKADYESTIFYSQQYTRSSGYRPNLFALVPIDMNHVVEEETYHLVEKVLLIMFPSDVKLTHLIRFGKRQGELKFTEEATYLWDVNSRWYLAENRNPDEFLLRCAEEEIEAANRFVVKAYRFLKDTHDFQLAIESYIECFHQRALKMAYVNLCMALESIVKAESEITHRICRTCAVINADNKEQGHQIYFNVKQFYTLRSKIVHGDNSANLHKYFFNLTALASRTLIELITFRASNRKVLERMVLESGFGDKRHFSNDYQKEDFNRRVSDLAIAPVPKYKS